MGRACNRIFVYAGIWREKPRNKIRALTRSGNNYRKVAFDSSDFVEIWSHVLNYIFILEYCQQVS